MDQGTNSETENATAGLSMTHAGPKSLEICNQRGLHARASAKFVKTCEIFDAEVTVEKGDYSVTGTSIMGLMMLAASKGCSVKVSAHGRQADEVMAALEALVADRFGEEI